MKNSVGPQLGVYTLRCYAEVYTRKGHDHELFALSFFNISLSHLNVNSLKNIFDT